MDTRHRSPAGGLVAPCTDQATCLSISCEVCLKEVPSDAALSSSSDAQDYVHYFCGLECLEIWQRRAGVPPEAGPAEDDDRLK